jgi:hypothetical protein
VLAGQRPAVRHDQVSGLFHERSVPGYAVSRPQLEGNSGVHAAVAEVPVQRCALVVVLGQQVTKVAQILPKPVWRHGGVVPATAILVTSAVATALLLGPVAYHRLVFRRRQKEHLVKAGNAMAIGGLAAVALAVSVTCGMPVRRVVVRLPAHPPGACGAEPAYDLSRSPEQPITV